MVFEIKWLTQPALSASTHLGQDVKSQPEWELHPALRNILKELVQKETKFNWLNASRKRGSFRIFPTDGARAFRPIRLDRRQLFLVREGGQIVEHINKKKRVVTFGNQKYV